MPVEGLPNLGLLMGPRATPHELPAIDIHSL